MFKTKLGKAVARLLGSSQDVFRMDKARHRHKTHPQNKCLYNDYMRELATVQTRIIAKLEKLKKQMNQWERDFFSKSGVLAMNEDINKDPTAAKISRLISLASVLLKEWNIDFHC